MLYPKGINLESNFTIHIVFLILEDNFFKRYYFRMCIHGMKQDWFTVDLTKHGRTCKSCSNWPWKDYLLQRSIRISNPLLEMLKSCGKEDMIKTNYCQIICSILIFVRDSGWSSTQIRDYGFLTNSFSDLSKLALRL